MKKNAYDAGREDGLYLALKIVREGGLEALEKEIRFRNITGIKTSLAMKEIEGATQEIKNNVIDTITCLAVHTLHDEFGFGKERAARYVNRFNEKVECLMDQLVYWEDMWKKIKRWELKQKSGCWSEVVKCAERMHHSEMPVFCTGESNNSIL